MSGAFALRKLLFADTEVGHTVVPGYHFSGTYSTLLSSAVLPHPAAVPPKNGLPLASVCFGSSLLASLTMKPYRRERWWAGGLFLSIVYYNSVKAHKVGNGVVGHQCGFLAASAGVIGCTARMMSGVGSTKKNAGLIAMFLGLAWYEVGRFHLWCDYLTEFRREAAPQRYQDLLGAYVPQDVEVDFLPFRDASLK